MGIVAFCPNGHRIKVKDSLAGRKCICPTCDARFRIPGTRTPSLPTARLLAMDSDWAARLPRAIILPLGEPSAGERVDPASDGTRRRATSRASRGRASETDGGRSRTRSRKADDATDIPVTSPGVDSARTGGLHSRIADRPDLAWCLAVPGGSSSPPMTANEMQSWLDTGLATGEELVWRSDWQEWAPIRLVFPEIGFPGGAEG